MKAADLMEKDDYKVIGKLVEKLNTLDGFSLRLTLAYADGLKAGNANGKES